MSKKRHLVRGVLAGLAGGLAVSWVMNEFMAGLGQKLQQAVHTMKAADGIVNVATGGEHLSWEERQKAGPVGHYAFGTLMGGLYGGLAEYCPPVRAAFGTTFGSALFTGADLIAVPVLHLGPAPRCQPKSALASPFAAHVVYGVTTELVRRIVRAIL